MASFITGIGDVLATIASWVTAFLPDSPFVMLEKNTQITEVLGYVNYFIPVDVMIAIGETWLVAIGIFYLYQAILRWAKAIE